MERSIDFDKYITINKEVSYSATSKIKCSILENKRIILKKYNNKKDKRYYKEKKNYLLLNDCYFIPKLIYYDDNNKILLFEDVGDSLKKIVIHNEYHVLPTYSNIIIQLYLMILQLYSKYKLVHNDITFRNICIKNGKLYLIDLESIGVYKYNKKKHPEVFTYNPENLILNDYNKLSTYVMKELRNKCP